MTKETILELLTNIDNDISKLNARKKELKQALRNMEKAEMLVGGEID